MVAVKVEPGGPDAGEMEVIAGTATVKPLNGALVPEGVVTVTVRRPRAAPGKIVTAIDTLVDPTKVIAAVTPVPLNVTPVAPDKFWPKSVTATVVLGAPDAGEIDEIVGMATEKPL